MRWRVGIDSQGVSCVKIMKGNFDPVTTPDSQVSAYFYNSKWAADVRVHLNFNPDRVVASNGTWVYDPPGSNRNTATRITLCQDPQRNFNWFRLSHFDPGRLYNLPLASISQINASTGRYQNGRAITSYLGEANRARLTETKNIEISQGLKAIIQGSSTTFDFGVAFTSDYSGSSAIRRGLTLWNLPGDETAIIDGTPQAPVPGQKVIQINKDYCRVAKPGFDVRFASTTQLAFDSSIRPPKIVAANDIAVPTGYSEYEIGFALPAKTEIDLVCYAGSTVHYPCNPQDTDFGAEYWITGSKIAFDNPGPACRARFIVIAHDDTPPTAGSNKVWRRFIENGQIVYQFLRPGAGANPSFADIILDSRWPCLQILAEGYIPVTANGEQTYTVPISADGMFPIVKWMTVHGARGGEEGWTKQIRTPKVGRAATRPNASWTRATTTGDTTYAQVTASQVVFRSFRGNPVKYSYANQAAIENDNPTIEYDTASIQGIRYYVFGIPA